MAGIPLFPPLYFLLVLVCITPGGRGSLEGSTRERRLSVGKGSIGPDATVRTRQSTRRCDNVGREGDGEIDGSSAAEGEDDDEDMGGGASGRENPNDCAEA